MSQEPESARRVHSLGRFLLIDLLIEKRSRPVLIYVAITASIGAAIYHFVEGWRWLDSFYFMVITMTTIGYGDLSPATDLGQSSRSSSL